MAPRRSSPLTVHFAKTPFLNLFFSSGGPKFKSRDGADLDAARVPAGRTWARVPRRPDLGSRSGAGLAPPPAGRGRSSSRAGASRRGGEAELPRRPSPASSSSIANPCRSAAVRSSLRPRRCSARRRRAPAPVLRSPSKCSTLVLRSLVAERPPHRHSLQQETSGEQDDLNLAWHR
jgi:hypothetical protein